MHLSDPLCLLILPSTCELCGKPLRSAQPWSFRLPRRLCPECLAEALRQAGLPAWQLEGLGGCALFWYEEQAAGWIRHIKEGGQPGFLADLAACWPRPPLDLPPTALLVPVPPDALRRRQRGGDHVARLARLWGRRWSLDCADLLTRRGGAKQQGLGAAERRVNLEGQYQLAKGALRPGGRLVALVDDVVTTGATLAVCRRRLVEGGWLVAGGLTLACAPCPDLRIANLRRLEGEDGAVDGREQTDPP